MTSIITRHLSDHHAVQGEAEYVERHAPITASHTPPQKEASMTTYMQRDGRITSAATDDMPERIWLDTDSYNGAVGFAHPEKHKKDGWPAYIRADLCASGQVRDARRDIGILLAQIDWLQECTGETLESDDAALVSQIRRDWSGLAPDAPQPVPPTTPEAEGGSDER